MQRHLPLTFALVVSFVCASVLAQSPGNRETTAQVWVSQVETAAAYRPIVDVTYLTVGNTELKLDLYVRRDITNATPTGILTNPNPTVIYIHGGGWTGTNRHSRVLALLPYLQMGFSVVNIDYRVAPMAPAPAAVEDCLCALRWVFGNAKQYGFDTNKIIVTGTSAGGHLALMTGMLPPGSDFDRQCFGPEQPKVAAIVQWYGITDVVDLLDGPNQQRFAVQWLSSRPNRAELARQLSPLTYVRAGLPPVLTIHGDADPTVPYAHARRLREALTSAGVTNEMVTVAGGGHGLQGWKPADVIDSYATVRAFLTKHNLMPGAPTISH